MAEKKIKDSKAAKGESETAGKSPAKRKGAPKNPRKKPEKKCEMLQIVPKKRRRRSNYIDGKFRTAFYRAFEETGGNVSASCELAGISRQTYYRWMQSPRRINEKFRARLALINPGDRFLDFAEAALLRRIQSGDTTAIIFYLKTKGKTRGYIEKNVELEYDLVLRAVARIENIINQQRAHDPKFKPDLKKFSELAAQDFGVKPEMIEKEFLKRQPQMLEGVQ